MLSQVIHNQENRGVQVSPTVKYADAKKDIEVFVMGLRKAITRCDAKAIMDRRWVNGFMAAGYHSGLITLRDPKLECLSATGPHFMSA